MDQSELFLDTEILSIHFLEVLPDNKFKFEVYDKLTQISHLFDYYYSSNEMIEDWGENKKLKYINISRKDKITYDNVHYKLADFNFNVKKYILDVMRSMCEFIKKS